MSNQDASSPDGSVTLRRSLPLPLVVLYGLGVTVGAGIYVLVGATAAKAGYYAPVSFILAACVTAFTGLSYAELSTRMPVSAGEAAYVRAGFNSPSLALVVGLMVAASGVISSAAVSIGAASYLQHFLPLSPVLLSAAIIIVLGLVAFWGIMESVILAGIFTIVEISGLGLVIYIGLSTNPDLANNIHQLVPPLELAPWAGIFSAGLLAFFAFIGFEDIANIAEEVKNPRRTMPWAILLTLIISTIVYVAVVAVVVLTVPMQELTTSASPLALVFAGSGAATANTFSAIAVVATLNGVLIQMIMASRILYGLASQGSLPKIISSIHPLTRTPVIATSLVVATILLLALFLPIAQLAETTSIIVLGVFSMVNLALILLKRKAETSGDIFSVPLWVPITGLISCLILFSSGLM